MRARPLVAAALVALAATAAGAGNRPVRLAMSRFSIQPGEDKEVCEYRRLPNRRPIDASGFDVVMPPGSHHFVLWAYRGPVTDDARFPDGPVESAGCVGVGPGELFPVNLFGQQTPGVRTRFPEGVAVRIAPRQQVWLNAHMKNLGSRAVRPRFKIKIHRAAPGSVRHYAEQFTVGNAADIRIPAGGTQRITSEFVVPADLNFVQLSSHQHSLGTYVGIEHVALDGGVTALYENHDWEHPVEREWPTEPLRLRAGERLRFTCGWENPRGHEVRFGTETTDEMCFMTGYYWREDGAPPLALPGCLPQATGLTCFVRGVDE